MSGIVVYTSPGGFYQETQTDGTFSLEDIPNGAYDVYFFHPGCLVKKIENILCSGNSTQLNLQLTPGEFQKNGIIDIFDRILLSNVWNLQLGDTGWDSVYDLVEDGIIDEADIRLLVQFIDETSTETGFYIPPEDTAIIIVDDLVVEIPAGAFDEPFLLTILPDSIHSEGIGLNQIVYDISASQEMGDDSLTISFQILEILPPAYYSDVQIAYRSEDQIWRFVDTDVDSIGLNAATVTDHLSIWAAFTPSEYDDYYYDRIEEGASSGILTIPYYSQGMSNWCAITSLAMVARAYGQQIKPQFIAANPLFAGDVIDDYISFPDFFLSYHQLAEEYIDNSFVSAPGWFLTTSLTGFLMSELDQGRPVIVGAPHGAQHAFVVVGYNETGIYVTDPSGSLYETAGLTINYLNQIARYLTWDEWWLFSRLALWT